MTASVNPSTNFGIAKRRDDLRLQLMVSEQARRVGERLRARRKELRLNQRELAALVGEPVNDQRISDWERAVNEPSPRYKEKLVAALKLENMGGWAYFYQEPDGSPDLIEALAPDRVGQLEAKVDALYDRLGRLLDEMEKPE